MVYFLFDNSADKKNMEFLKEYDTASFKLLFPKEQCLSIKSMIKVCNECIGKSSNGDTVICWYDFMGILCWWLCKFTFRKRNIVALNILLKNKKSLKNKIARMLYRPALKSKKMVATVTSKEYGASINRLLGIKKQYVLLHDIYHGGYDIGYTGQVQKNSVFCGGRNGRAWDFLFQSARQMPDIQFNIVAPKAIFEEYENNFSNNVNLKTEIPEPEFIKLMCKSSLVLMPLDTEAPAGLIAIFQAAANKKLIIASNTVTTREYFGEQRGVLCENDLGEWEKQIRYWLEHPDDGKIRTEKLRAFLEAECSEKKYSEILMKLVER